MEKQKNGAESLPAAVAKMPEPKNREEESSESLLEELRSLRAHQREWVFREDLQKIKKAFPEAELENVMDLGDDFLKMRSVGVDAIVAYCAIQAAKDAETPAPPPEIGSVAAENPGEKEFLSPDEVRRMNPEQIRKNLKKIEKSQKKW